MVNRDLAQQKKVARTIFSVAPHRVGWSSGFCRTKPSDKGHIGLSNTAKEKMQGTRCWNHWQRAANTGSGVETLAALKHLTMWPSCVPPGHRTLRSRFSDGSAIRRSGIRRFLPTSLPRTLPPFWTLPEGISERDSTMLLSALDGDLHQRATASHMLI